MNRYGIIDLDRFTSFGIVGDSLYAVTNEGGYLIRIDQNTGSAEYICSAVDERFDEYPAYTTNIEDTVYSINFTDNHITIMRYNENLNDVNTAMELCCDMKSLYIIIAEKYKESVYVFTMTGQGILVLSETCRIINDDIYTSIIERCKGAVRVEDKVLFFLNDNNIFEFDLETERISKCGELKRDGNIIRDIFYDGTGFNILKSDAHIIVLDKNFCENNDIYLGLDYGKTYFSRIIKVEQKYILLPSNGDEICLVDMNHNIKNYKDYPEDFGWCVSYENRTLLAKFNYYVEDEDFFYFPKRATDYILKICKKSGELIWMKVNIHNVKKKIDIEKKRGNFLLLELGKDDLYAFVDYVIE